MELQDSIEREMILKANIDNVWDAITNPKKLSQWFGDHAEINVLDIGEPIRFGWGNDVCQGVIETVSKPNVFAFRWQSSRLGHNVEFSDDYATLVTFTLTSIPTGTHLHMIETGFASLPEQIIDTSAVSSSGATISENTDSIDSTTDTADNKLPHNQQAYNDNVSGWDYEFNDLKDFLESGKLS